MPGCAPNKLELDAETCEDIAETLYSRGKAAGGGVTFKLSRENDGLHVSLASPFLLVHAVEYVCFFFFGEAQHVSINTRI